MYALDRSTRGMGNGMIRVNAEKGDCIGAISEGNQAAYGDHLFEQLEESLLVYIDLNFKSTNLQHILQKKKTSIAMN